MKIFIFAAGLLFCSFVNANAAGAGSATGEFLNIGVGAKAAALGGAMTARAEGAEAIYWNPAGLAGLKSAEAVFSHTLWIFETSHTSAGFALPLGERTALGVLVNYFSAGTMDKVDNTALTAGTFSASDLSAAVCLSAKLTDKLPIGISLKFISSTIEEVSGIAFAADFGLKYVLSNDFTLGAGIYNLGTKLKHSVVEEDLPLSIRGGVLLKLLGASLSADAILPSAGNAGFSTGAKYVFSLSSNSLVAARAGYESRVSTGGLSAGAGFAIGALNLDYAFLMFGDLGNNHRFSIKIGI